MTADHITEFLDPDEKLQVGNEHASFDQKSGGSHRGNP
jgi:hypothetical protein